MFTVRCCRAENCHKCDGNIFSEQSLAVVKMYVLVIFWCIWIKMCLFGKTQQTQVCGYLKDPLKWYVLVTSS